MRYPKTLAGCHAEIDRLRAELAAIRPELAKLGAAVLEQAAKPPGYEHYTADFVKAIAATCSTQAERVGKTQDQVFADAAAALPYGPPRPCFHDLKHAACAQFRVTPEAFDGPARGPALNAARRLAWFQARKLTPLSFAAIGRLSGGRDHSTICHGVACEEAERAGGARP